MILDVVNAVVFLWLLVFVRISGGDDLRYGMCVHCITERRTGQRPSYMKKVFSLVFILPSDLTLRC